MQQPSPESPAGNVRDLTARVAAPRRRRSPLAVALGAVVLVLAWTAGAVLLGALARVAYRAVTLGWSLVP